MEDAKKALNQINAGDSLTIDVPYELTIKNKSYKGTVGFRFPSVRDQIAIGLEEAKLRGNVIELNGKPELLAIPAEALDSYTAHLVEAIATIRVLAVDKKENYEVMPPEVISEIYRGYLRAEGDDGTLPDDGDTENTGADTGETSEQSV